MNMENYMTCREKKKKFVQMLQFVNLVRHDRKETNVFIPTGHLSLRSYVPIMTWYPTTDNP